MAHLDSSGSDGCCEWEGLVAVNLLFGAVWEGPICVIFRVYRPSDVPICPTSGLPQARFVPKSTLEAIQDRFLRRGEGENALCIQNRWKWGSKQEKWRWLFATRHRRPATIKRLPPRFGSNCGHVFCQLCVGDSGTITSKQKYSAEEEGGACEDVGTESEDEETEPYLAQCPQGDALENGRNLGDYFQRSITSKLKPLGPEKLGTQFFHPTDVMGLFPNIDASYVAAFLPEEDGVSGAVGMRLSARVPVRQAWRPFYGAMAVSYGTTETLGSLDAENLGGWGAPFVLFVSRDEATARLLGGYDPEANPSHRLLLWGKEASSPGLVLRYLHFVDEILVVPPESESKVKSAPQTSPQDHSQSHSLEGGSVDPTVANIEVSTDPHLGFFGIEAKEASKCKPCLKAREERRRLCLLDGTRETLEFVLGQEGPLPGVPGMSFLEYY